MQKIEEYKSPMVNVFTVNVMQVVCVSNPDRYSSDTDPEQDVF